MEMPLYELSARDARDFFLREDSYCNFDLPSYFSFQDILDFSISVHENDPDNAIKFWGKAPGNDSNVNYRLLVNKDGFYNWREFQLIHPLFYTGLVRVITEEENWKLILERFQALTDDRIFIASNQVVQNLSHKNSQTKTDILNWWEKVEQRSLANALKYRYVGTTDISNCYPSIYTHSIPWALHTRDKAKKSRRCQDLVGNQLDALFQQMNEGQTNGIPQGNRVSDFIAELVLSYCDRILLDKVDEQNSGLKNENFEIIRYRDDYRIFANSRSTVEGILKSLNEAAGILNFRLNRDKTDISENIIQSSIKPDKFSLKATSTRNTPGKLQENLLNIFSFSQDFPSSGSIMKLLHEFRADLDRISREPRQLRTLIAIIAEIMKDNPRTYPIGVAILSKLISYEKSQEELLAIVGDIEGKFRSLPNIGYLLIWLQRLTVSTDQSRTYFDELCRVVAASSHSIKHPWSNEWIAKTDVARKFSDISIVSQEEINDLSVVIPRKETEVFDQFIY